jgi:hypothetical protein
MQPACVQAAFRRTDPSREGVLTACRGHHAFLKLICSLLLSSIFFRWKSGRSSAVNDSRQRLSSSFPCWENGTGVSTLRSIKQICSAGIEVRAMLFFRPATPRYFSRLSAKLQQTCQVALPSEINSLLCLFDGGTDKLSVNGKTKCPRCRGCAWPDPVVPELDDKLLAETETNSL